MSNQLPEKAGDEYFMRKGEVCGSGRSKGTQATRMGTSDWRNDRYLQDDGYKSKWRKRKERRYKNLCDFENNITTPATEFMRKQNINVVRVFVEKKPYVKKIKPITVGEKKHIDCFRDAYYGRATEYNDDGKPTKKAIPSWLMMKEPRILFEDYVKQKTINEIPYGFRKNWC